MSMAPYHRAMLRAVRMAEISHKNKMYELCAVCARKIAEIYVDLVLAPQEWWSLGEGLSLMQDVPDTLWQALKTAQYIGNSGAHAREGRMTEKEGDDALSAAMLIAKAYLAHIHVPRARM